MKTLAIVIGNNNSTMAGDAKLTNAVNGATAMSEVNFRNRIIF